MATFAFHSSVAVPVGGGSPPKANAAVCVPVPECCDLAMFKSVVVVQIVPSQSSVAAELVGGTTPPKAIPSVVVPAAAD